MIHVHITLCIVLRPFMILVFWRQMFVPILAHLVRQQTLKSSIELKLEWYQRTDNNS